jgi:acetylornithine/N-succinyldiaminopimelate aminotransferase
MSTPAKNAAASVPAEPHVMKTFGRLPIALSHGKGSRVWDVHGKAYLDALSGIAVNTLGHAHPKLVPALQDQVAKLMHTSNNYYNPLAETLASELCRLSGLSNVFFCNSGLEANEGAIKLALRHGVNRGIERPEIIVFERAFHGRSMATLSATGNVKIQKGFGPLVGGFVRVPLNNLDAMRDVARTNKNVCAVFLETIQGEGGINPTRFELLRDIEGLCREQNWLYMLDEVQCGMGRTGKWFAYQWANVTPDVVPMAKGLGSGVPVGAILCGPRAKDLFLPGDHGTTFGGNPLAMRAGVETLRIMHEDGILQSAADVGAYLKTELERQLGQVSGFKEIRGMGLMMGLQLDRPCGPLMARAADAGLLLSVTADSVIRLLPPLTFSRDEADELMRILVPMVKQFLHETQAAQAVAA